MPYFTDISSVHHHIVTLSHHHIVTLSRHHVITLSRHHFIISSHCQVIILSNHQFITSSQCHFITPSRVTITISSSEDSYVVTRLRTLTCVLREDDSVVMASDCYDPADSLLAELLYGERLFPAPSFSSSQSLEALRLLGMIRLSLSIVSASARSIYDISDYGTK